jgi:hypothetical protein
MKLKPLNDNSATAHDTRAHDAQIDAALRVYGRAVPAPGLESRVAARISATPRHSFRTKVFSFSGNPRLALLRGFTIGALAAAAACGIVVGTVRHSQQIAIPQAAAPRPGGVSTAGARHIPTHAVPQSATIDPQAPRTAPHSRATVSRNTGSKPAGSAVPRSPYPPDQSSSSAPQQ